MKNFYALIFAIFLHFVAFCQNPTSSLEILESLKYQNELIENSIVKNLEFKNIGPSVMSGRVSDIEVNPNNPNEFYKFLLTPKNLRKKISKVNVNFTYLFDEKNININDIRIDGKTLEKSKYTFDDILLKENNLQNKIYFKNLLNEVIKSYSG